MKKILFLSSFLLLVSCKTAYFVSSIEDSQQKFDDQYIYIDEEIEEEILPYRIELETSMNQVLVEAAKDLVKAKPESTLGNLLADATLKMTSIYTESKVDVAIINYGGIRVPSISKGNVTLGNVYELMPFDNYLVSLNLSGEVLNEVLQKIASGGGWPIAGVKFTIREGKAEGITINGKPLDFATIYHVAISDYLANGGDNLEMLKGLPQSNTNVLLRDAFIEYFKMIQKEGKKLDANIENRITNE